MGSWSWMKVLTVTVCKNVELYGLESQMYLQLLDIASCRAVEGGNLNSDRACLCYELSLLQLQVSRLFLFASSTRQWEWDKVTCTIKLSMLIFEAVDTLTLELIPTVTKLVPSPTLVIDVPVREASCFSIIPVSKTLVDCSDWVTAGNGRRESETVRLTIVKALRTGT